MMGRINAWWARGPSARTLIILIALAAAAVVVRWYIVAPLFAQQLGFIPFDLQPRLNQGMLVIQMGAARGHPFNRLYGAFVMSDIPISLMLAFATVAVWRWLHLKTPNRAYDLLAAGGIMLLPVIVAAAEMVEHRVVFDLLQSRGREGYADAVELLVRVHNVKAALVFMRDGATVVFLAATGILVFLRRKTGGAHT